MPPSCSRVGRPLRRDALWGSGRRDREMGVRVWLVSPMARYAKIHDSAMMGNRARVATFSVYE